MPIPQESEQPMSANDVKVQTAAPESQAAERAAKILSPAAQRALAEAQARRAAIDAKAAAAHPGKELNGRGGLEPVRYDDWEVKGIASDF